MELSGVEMSILVSDFHLSYIELGVKGYVVWKGVFHNGRSRKGNLAFDIAECVFFCCMYAEAAIVGMLS